MSILVALRHTTHYQYDRPINLSPHLIRLRPAAHSRTPIRSYSLNVKPGNHFVNWQQDPFGNFVARYVFPERTTEFEIDVEVIAEMTVINPFDFFIEDEAKEFPFDYSDDLGAQLAPYLKISEDGPLLQDYVERIDRGKKDTTSFLVDLNRELASQLQYTIRMEAGVQTCEETLSLKRGSCRDSAWLLVQVFRHLGLAARFVSGYLVQLTADQKSLDGPSGPEQDFTDLHAWAEVFIPGAGWIGLDPTSGLFAGEGHIPLACTPEPQSAAPVVGMTDKCETVFTFNNVVTRIHEDPRVTKPYSEAQWARAMALGDEIDQRLQQQDVRLTQGGEPTFVSIDDMDSPQWNTAALGTHKESLARDLLLRLRERFAPNSLLHHGQGKWYPGEELPRWAYSCFFRADGKALWTDTRWLAPAQPAGSDVADARRFALALARKLKVGEEGVAAAYEDAEHYLHQEAGLPVDLDPHKANLKDPLERRRLARLLKGGLDKISGYVLPVSWDYQKDGWHSAPWPLRRDKLVLLPGDSPMGYRLPLASLPWRAQRKRAQVAERDSFDLRADLAGAGEGATALTNRFTAPKPPPILPQAIADQGWADEENREEDIPHTALCIEPRDGRLWVFMPPLTHLEHWVELVSALEAAAKDCGLALDLEGYEPPNDPRLRKFAVTPDPGVIEVNIHPADNWPTLVGNIEALYEEARLTRLGTEKFMLDGRHTGTCGGNHVTLGAATPGDSPFLRRPDLLGSLVLYWQHHPSLSYLFSGLFIGPTSQAPRVDEARNDALYELEIALQQLGREDAPQPWLVDRLFRNLLVDVTGNTHRAEFCIDKLYSPAGPTGRLGLLELRAFEMPPHWQMNAVQMLLLRALVSAFWDKPYRGKPVYWGTALHDRFLLPHFVEEDLNVVLGDLAAAGFTFDPAWFAPFMHFRFPHCGRLVQHDMELELTGAIEPWHVLGEEVTSQGTSRFVDSSVERLQVKVKNFVPGRYCVTCNGRRVPLLPTNVEGEFVAGVRFKAWQPAFGLHPRLPADAPLVFDIVDLHNRKSIGGCTYHVAHPSGRNYETFPVNANEAEARRIARFWQHGHSSGNMDVAEEESNGRFPCTLDLRYRP